MVYTNLEEREVSTPLALHISANYETVFCNPLYVGGSWTIPVFALPKQSSLQPLPIDSLLLPAQPCSEISHKLHLNPISDSDNICLQISSINIDIILCDYVTYVQYAACGLRSGTELGGTCNLSYVWSVKQPRDLAWVSGRIPQAGKWWHTIMLVQSMVIENTI